MQEGVAICQDERYEMFAHYTSENGLPQNSITGIRQDKKGFIWITTNGGLVRFDGHGFRTFNMVQYNPNASNRLQNLADIDGRLFANEEGLEDIFEIENENTIRAVKRSNYVVTWRKGEIYRINKELGQYKGENNFNSRTDLIIDSNGTEGYAVIGDKTQIGYYHYPAAPVNLPVQSWRDMDNAFCLGKRLYVIDNFSRLLCFEGSRQMKTSGSFQKLVESLPEAVIKESRIVQSAGEVFFATNEALYLLTESAPGFVDAGLLTGRANQPDKVVFLYLPDLQVLFIGTGNDGLFLYRLRQFRTLHVPEKLPVFFEQTRNFKKPINVFYQVAELDDSTVLTEWGGLTMSGRMLPSRNLLFNVRNIPILAPGIFVGAIPGNDRPRITDRQLNDLGFFDKDSSIERFSLSTSEMDTLYFRLLIRGTWKIRKYLYKAPYTFEQLDEFPGNSLFTQCIVKQRGDTLWMGTNKGLFALNLRKKRLENLPGLEQTVVRALYCDQANTLWIGTYGKGWYRYDKKGLVRLYNDRNLNLENVHAFLEDNAGYLWVSTNNGLFRFLKADLQKTRGPDDPVYYNYFTKEYGFNTNEFNGGSNPSALKMSNGNFVFPGMNGLVIFNPLQVTPEQPNSGILLGEFSLDGKFIDSLEGRKLHPGFNNISLRVFTPYFGQHYNLQMEYRLSSGTDTWIKLPDNGMLSFNRLAYGDYVLSIRMLKGFGTNDYITREISFSVEPRWFQTSWFYLSVIGFAVLAAVWFARWRTRNIEHQKKQLLEEVAARTEELRLSEVKVRQNAQFKSQVTSLVLHDVRSPLYYLHKITGSIYQASEGKVEEEFRDQLKDLHLSVKDISAYAQTLFAWISAQQDDFVLKQVPVKIAAMLNEISANYQLLAAQNNNTIEQYADPALVVITQTDLLQIVLRNLVDNAIKFTKNGKISLSAEMKTDGVHIVVADTGKGMSDDRVDLILSNETNIGADTRSGMGYRLIKDLLKKMDGQLKVVSKQGDGSAITIILPVKVK